VTLIVISEKTVEVVEEGSGVKVVSGVTVVTVKMVGKCNVKLVVVVGTVVREVGPSLV